MFCFLFKLCPEGGTSSSRSRSRSRSRSSSSSSSSNLVEAYCKDDIVVVQRVLV